MPTPKKGETRSEYMARCVPIVKAEGKDSKAAVGKCEGMFDSHRAKECQENMEERLGIK